MVSFLDNHRHHLSLAVIILAAFALRLYRLADANIWWDEGFSVWEARMSLAALADRTAYDVHPPFYYWLLHFWRLAVGDGAFQLRFLSIAFGILTLVMLWSLARWLLPDHPDVALVASFLYAISRYMVWWSQEIRMYALAGFLALLSLYAMLRLRRHFAWLWAVVYVLATALALLSLYTLAFLLVVEGLYWLWTLRRERTLRRRMWLLREWTLLQMAVLALFLPWLAYALPRMWRWSVQETFDVPLFWQLYATMLHVGVSVNIQALWPAVAAALLTVAAGVLCILRSAKTPWQRDSLTLLLLMLFIPPLAVLLLTHFPNAFGYSPRVQARYFYPFAAIYYLLVAWAVASLASRLPRGQTLASGVLLTGFAFLAAWGLRDYYTGRYLQDDYQSVALTLAAHARSDDAILLQTDQSWPIFAFHWPHSFIGWPHGQNADEVGIAHWVQPLWQTHTGLWLVVNEDALRVDSQQLVAAWLSQRALAQHEWRFGSRRLLLFARTPTRADALLALAPGWQPPPPAQPLAASKLSVIGWEQPLTRVRAGDFVHVAVTLTGRLPTSTLPITLSLGDPAIVSATLPPLSGPGPWRLPISFALPPDAPPGRYSYRLHIGDTAAVMGWLTILPPPRGLAMIDDDVVPDHPLIATFGDPPLAELLGYDLAGNAFPGGELTLTLYWLAQRPAPVSYKVFVHLIGADGRPASQGDAFPLGGLRPTTSWLPGEHLRDSYTILLPPDLPSGDYPLRIGFYDSVTGQRLSPVYDEHGREQADDQLSLQIITLP